MDDQKQPDTPGIGGETFSFMMNKDWLNPTVGYVVGVDSAFYDCERSVASVIKKEESTEGQLVAYFTPVHQPTLDEYGQLVEKMGGYYGTSIIKETKPPLTFKQLEENIRWYGPHPLLTYMITGALDWRYRYIDQERRDNEWKGSMVRSHLIFAH